MLDKPVEGCGSDGGVRVRVWADRVPPVSFPPSGERMWLSSPASLRPTPRLWSQVCHCLTLSWELPCSPSASILFGGLENTCPKLGVLMPVFAVRHAPGLVFAFLLFFSNHFILDMFF